LFYGANAASKTAILSAADFALTGCVPLPTGERKTSVSAAAAFAGSTANGARVASVAASVEHNGRRLMLERRCEWNEGSASQTLAINGVRGTLANMQSQVARITTVLDPESILRMKPADLRAYLCGITGVEGDSPLPALHEKWGNRMSLPTAQASWIDAILYAINAANEHVKDAERLRRDAERDLQRSPTVNAVGVGGLEASRQRRAEADERYGKLLREKQAADASAKARANATQSRALAAAELEKLSSASFQVPPPPEIGATALRAKVDRQQREYAATVGEWRTQSGKIGAAERELEGLAHELELRKSAPVSRALACLESAIERLDAEHPARAHVISAKSLLDPLVVPTTRKEKDQFKALKQYLTDNQPTPCPEPPDVSELLRRATEADHAQGAHDLAQRQESKRQARIAELRAEIEGHDRRLAELLPAPPPPEAIEAARTTAQKAGEDVATAELAAKAEEARSTLSERAKFHREEHDAYRTMRDELQGALDSALADKIKPFADTVNSSLALMQEGAQMLLESGTERGRLVLSMLASWRGARVDYESTMSGAERRLFWLGVAIAHARLANVPGPLLLAELGDLDYDHLRGALNFIAQSGVACLAATHVLRGDDANVIQKSGDCPFSLVSV